MNCPVAYRNFVVTTLMLDLAIQQFNEQEFYACHDTLEALWMEAIEPDRSFYQGLLQMAVGLYHFSHENQRGAAILLGEGMGRLEPYRPDYSNVNLEPLLTAGQRWLQWIQTEAEHSTERQPFPWPQIQYCDTP
ncbi:MAG: DUF309 domain-containing protein [Prochlorotrichaceae cyanobacterium]